MRTRPLGLSLVVLGTALGCGEIREVPVELDAGTGATDSLGATSDAMTSAASGSLDDTGVTTDQDDPGTGPAPADSSSTGEPPPVIQHCTAGAKMDARMPSFELPLDVPATANVVDVTIGIRMQHPLLAELRLELVAPDGTVVQLLDQPDCEGENLQAVFDDLGSGSASELCIPGEFIAVQGMVTPVQPLAPLLGQTNVAGTWTLRVDAASGVGLIENWCVILGVPG
ncbi:MAG: proprotein convertase P-domain-containing protein [Myxococcota bacterium]